MTPRLERFVIALMVALMFAGVSLGIARAQSATPPPADKTSSTSCASCHPEYYAAWQSGAHSKTRTEHVMQQAANCIVCHQNIPSGDMSVTTPAGAAPGQMQSNICTQCHVTGYNPATGTWKEDGVACEACHSPIPANHPEQDIPVDKSTDLCRKCHSEARFGWDAWKTSVHYQNKIVCTTCHDSHSTAFKLSDLSTGDASALCQNCHKEVAQDAQHSAHTNAGVTCIKCHLGDKTGPDVFHKVPDHSFKPKLETCNGCHAKDMHGAAQTTTYIEPEPTLTAVVETPSATPQPKIANISLPVPLPEPPSTPANTAGFIGIAALFGLAGGIVLSILRKR